MAHKPTLEDIVRKLLDNAIFYETHIALKPYEIVGVDIEEQLRAALHEIELQDLLAYDEHD